MGPVVRLFVPDEVGEAAGEKLKDLTGRPLKEATAQFSSAVGQQVGSAFKTLIIGAAVIGGGYVAFKYLAAKRVARAL